MVAEMARGSKPDKSSGMLTIDMVVTPEQAQSWLDTMPIQRRLRKAKITQQIRLVEEGRWKLMPHGPVIDWNGQLRDGQHRCTVCVRTGKPLPMRVTFNADPDLYLDIDDGTAPKTLEDMLKFQGVPSGLATIMSMSIRFLFREERGMSPMHSALWPTNVEGQEVYSRHPLLIEAAELASRCRLAPSRALACFAIYKGLLADDEITRIFVDQLADGEGLRIGDPALVLRNTWINDRTKMIKREYNDQLIMFVATLNDAIAGKRRQSWRGVEFGKGKIPAVRARKKR